jgi:hypothetical protein
MPDKGGERQKRDRAEREAQARKAPATKSESGNTPAKRPQHQDTDYEHLLREAERRNWRISKDGGYFKCLCPCADRHWVSVVLTPGKQRTLINTRKNFERTKCWKEATG